MWYAPSFEQAPRASLLARICPSRAAAWSGLVVASSGAPCWSITLPLSSTLSPHVQRFRRRYVSPATIAHTLSARVLPMSEGWAHITTLPDTAPRQCFRWFRVRRHPATFSRCCRGARGVEHQDAAARGAAATSGPLGARLIQRRRPAGGELNTAGSRRDLLGTGAAGAHGACRSGSP